MYYTWREVLHQMSKIVPIRIPDELIEKIDAKGPNRSATIIDILTRALTPTTAMVTLPVSGPNYQRVAHDQRCTCHTCRPPARA